MWKRHQSHVTDSVDGIEGHVAEAMVKRCEKEMLAWYSEHHHGGAWDETVDANSDQVSVDHISDPA